MMVEKTITFTNRNNERLFGILHLPESESDRPSPHPLGVVCLNTGMQYRTIWHRLNVKIARYLCGLGIPVLRFDTHGIGDSEGEFYLPEATGFEDYHDRIQLGLFVEDTQDAISFFKQTVSQEKTVLLGPCGGALTGMITASRTPAVDGLIYMAGPVTITSSELTLEMHPRDAQVIVRNLPRKLLRPMSWFHFLTGQSEYGRFWRAIKVNLRDRFNHDRLFRSPANPSGGQPKKASSVTSPSAPNGSGMIFNSVFLESFNAFMVRGGQVAFLMPEMDRSSWGFKEMFQDKYLQPGHQWSNQVVVHYVRNANHIYQEIQAQQELMERIGRFAGAFLDDCRQVEASV